jgi:hypothetical protein
VGFFLAAAGVLLTLDNLGIVDAGDYFRYWPAALVAIGIVKVWASRGQGGGFAGVIFIAVGAWLLLESADVVRVSLRDAWPILLVLLGVSILWRGIRGTPAAPGGDANATVTAFAILGGVNRGSNSKAFRGGDLTAILGGCEIDLRQAAIDGEATIDVFAMWGGIEIRVPENWTVIGRVNPVLGGFDDQTRPPQGAAAHRLIVRGFVVMGGVEVKN